MISIKLQSNLVEIRLRHRCSPVNLLHFFRTPFSKNTPAWLFLKIIISARRILSSVLPEKLLLKIPRQYHAPTKITFADNQHKFDSRTTSFLLKWFLNSSSNLLYYRLVSKFLKFKYTIFKIGSRSCLYLVVRKSF